MSFEDAVRDVATRSVPGSGFHVEEGRDEVKPVSQIDSLLMALGDELATLHDVTDKLSVTLFPVLTPSDGLAETTEDPDIPPFSPVAMRLVGAIDKIRRVRYLLGDLDQRVEV